VVAVLTERDDGSEVAEPEANRTARVGVLISGAGRTLANLIEKIGAGTLDVEIVVVVSSRAGVRGLEIAEAAGIPGLVVSRNAHPDDAAFSNAIYATIAPFEPDLIVCGGFMKRLVVSPDWEGRILNIHPCLIPESNAAGAGFYGGRVHEAVIACGATTSGATVHVVDNEYDHGPVVMKETVPVLAGDTANDLAVRVFALECDLYPRAIAAYLSQHPGLIRRSRVDDRR
jgi:formyltetrahydrofolate-dependent phosphoribosylglycinamide formyltransferase